MKRAAILLTLLLFVTSCHQKSCIFEPTVCFTPPCQWVEKTESAFEELSSEERSQDWGKELLIGTAFAKEMDLYRAITCFKRAEILIPEESQLRLLQIEYDVLLCYYIGLKYADVIEIFENSELSKVGPAFPAFGNLLIILYDCYHQLELDNKAQAVLKLIEKCSPETAKDLILSTALVEGDIYQAEFMLCDMNKPYTTGFLEDFHREEKSVRKAQFLNAVLPGAGYLYVGQRKSAITSFVINALFATAAYQFFHHNYIAAGIITTSLELGWYLGGINGAGLEAKAYNERLYEECGRPAFVKDQLFPVLMFQTTF